MRVLTDQDVYKLTIDKLKEWEHDVVTAKDLDMQKASDDDLLNAARKSNRLLITRDKNFGALLFLREEKVSTGVILLRGAPKTIEKVHQELQKLLHEHNEDELRCSFSVVEPNRYRIRRL
jgi:predicted nuclease of predicted toxin-antitoxin system